MLDCSHILEIVPPPTQGHRQQSNLTTPPMFGTKIRIESQMFDCKHILEILLPPTQGPTGPQTTVQLNNPPMFGTKIRIESQMFYFSDFSKVSQ